MRLRRTGGFLATGNDGKTYEVIEYTEFLDATTVHDTQRKEVPGMKTYKLLNGDHVNPPSQGANIWTVVKTGTKLTPRV